MYSYIHFVFVITFSLLNCSSKRNKAQSLAWVWNLEKWDVVHFCLLCSYWALPLEQRILKSSMCVMPRRFLCTLGPAWDCKPRVRFQMSEKSLFISEAELTWILQQKMFWKAVQMGVEHLEVNSLDSNYAQVTLTASSTFTCTTVSNAFWVPPFSRDSGFSNWPPWALLQRPSRSSSLSAFRIQASNPWFSPPFLQSGKTPLLQGEWF